MKTFLTALFVATVANGQTASWDGTKGRELTHNTPENCIKKCNSICSGSDFCRSTRDCRFGCLFGDLVVGGCGDEVGSLFTNGKGCQKEPTGVDDFSILSDCDAQCGNDNSDFESCHEGCLFFHQLLSGSDNKRGTKNIEDQEFFAFVSCKAICRYSEDVNACRTGCRELQRIGRRPAGRNDDSLVTECNQACVTADKNQKICGQGCKAMNDLMIGEFTNLLYTQVGNVENPDRPEDDPEPFLDPEETNTSENLKPSTLLLFFVATIYHIMIFGGGL